MFAMVANIMGLQLTIYNFNKQWEFRNVWYETILKQGAGQ